MLFILVWMQTILSMSFSFKNKFQFAKNLFFKTTICLQIGIHYKINNKLIPVQSDTLKSKNIDRELSESKIKRGIRKLVKDIEDNATQSFNVESFKEF
ncbi:hypothetical protein GLOIN_2v1701125 [Rhizophagus irregularis DAOM 181602=DAOM 197198]|uniref:Uncharacterized protein n=1 Tax=Rhizophagus irregularis (strain DAOM 181602 / DAOM 197198 / MUCL 43194) TaxID=747089 RepID=A0A2P4P915_RHIID|nr:hypothetical protein GLOIN_2v1701125 [Rhizophagus irregularis DAOM 181602=DAOM 197198]POG61871.1 hypothetical protein GLOIN_2v1701125 [Rhizophagus irregularis DAOM 181602=DAOM 197198]GET60192.1 hypothetical protein GLOIN_2v1701125 [Rhizophagus irregularis DAOM 181602=DAOM 197198]|eukprot:XP_025168737.1 hypothetical protein GLOIN_2v1701125 [Rhizophagus irregularis DAOM 181602=DAOM 197198]